MAKVSTTSQTALRSPKRTDIARVRSPQLRNVSRYACIVGAEDFMLSISALDDMEKDKFQDLHRSILVRLDYEYNLFH